MPKIAISKTMRYKMVLQSEMTTAGRDMPFIPVYSPRQIGHDPDRLNRVWMLQVFEEGEWCFVDFDQKDLASKWN